MVAFNRIRRVALAAVAAVPMMLLAADVSLEECQAQAVEGNAEAQWRLGQRYENGDGVTKNVMRAVAQYKKAAEQRHRKACERLAALYESGQFVKRDPVLAAKYKAWAVGGNGELAAAQARKLTAEPKEDEIETALDYILGRKGKVKDPKTGIRILYQAAKDKPVAQRVFVDRWSRGDLDDAVDVLSDDEWVEMLSWFKNVWEAGDKRAGLMLGNDAYSRKQWSAALAYWEGSGLARCWCLVGRFYATWSEEGRGGGPSDMRDESKSRKAYEKCLRIDSTMDEARFALGCLYLFAEKPENENLAEAKRIFSYFLKKDPDNKWYNFDYGLAGYLLLDSQFDKEWPRQKIDRLLAWAKRGDGRYVSPGDRGCRQDYNRMVNDWETLQRSQKKFVSHIKKAADLGCEPAQEFMADYNNRSK